MQENVKTYTNLGPYRPLQCVINFSPLFNPACATTQLYDSYMTVRTLTPHNTKIVPPYWNLMLCEAELYITTSSLIFHLPNLLAAIANQLQQQKEHVSKHTHMRSLAHTHIHTPSFFWCMVAVLADHIQFMS
jgi:hypothetical protein